MQMFNLYYCQDDLNQFTTITYKKKLVTTTYDRKNCYKRTDIVKGDIVVFLKTLSHELCVGRIVKIEEEKWETMILNDESYHFQKRGKIVNADQALMAKATLREDFSSDEAFEFWGSSFKKYNYEITKGSPLFEMMSFDDLLNYIAQEKQKVIDNATECDLCQKHLHLVGNYVKDSTHYFSSINKYGDTLSYDVSHGVRHAYIDCKKMAIVKDNESIVLEHINYKNRESNPLSYKSALCYHEKVHVLDDGETLIEKELNNSLTQFDLSANIAIHNIAKRAIHNTKSVKSSKKDFKSAYTFIYPKEKRFCFESKKEDFEFLWRAYHNEVYYTLGDSKDLSIGSPRKKVVFMYKDVKISDVKSSLNLYQKLTAARNKYGNEIYNKKLAVLKAIFGEDAFPIWISRFRYICDADDDIEFWKPLIDTPSDYDKILLSDIAECFCYSDMPFGFKHNMSKSELEYFTIFADVLKY